ncbi:MAG: hypothetical protein H7138_20270 [Myxococcales bacterium]|nr:hypothetical protein [Myxococcales bacterium]
MSIEDEIKSLPQAFPPHLLDPTAAFSEWGGPTPMQNDSVRASGGGRGSSSMPRSFASVKSKVQSESDADAKQYVSKLVDKYTPAEKGHQEAIDITNRGIDKCKGKR